MGCVQNRSTYRDEVWLLMHRDSDSFDTQTAALRLCLDESGGEDPGTPHSVIGGMLIYKPAFRLFEEEWDRMLAEYEISDGLHMKEFGRPHGRHAKMTDCCRRELFDAACHLVQKYKAISVATSMSNEEYRACVPEVARKMYSVYAMGFSLMVMLNHKLAEFNKYADPIPIIMDSGNPKSGQVALIHGWMQLRFQKLHYLHLGSLTFDNDKNWGLLQAADMIAWGTRRKESNVPFGTGFAPIEGLLSDDRRHAHQRWDLERLTEFGSDLERGIIEEQGMPPEFSE